MRDYLELGPTPAGESCQQVGMPTYNDIAARAECNSYKEMLEGLFPECEFAVKSFPHDFGNYREVVVYLDKGDPYKVDANLPEFWED